MAAGTKCIGKGRERGGLAQVLLSIVSGYTFIAAWMMGAERDK